MIASEPFVAPEELLRRTGWAIKPEGACKGEACVPLRGEVVQDGRVDLRAFAEAMGGRPADVQRRPGRVARFVA